MAARLVVVAAAAAVVAGCGGDDSSNEKPAAPKAAAPPAELQGTYNVTLKPGDLPKGPPEFKPENNPYRWRIEITKDGGVDNGPTLNIVSVENGSLESPALAVAGDELRLSNEECAAEGGYSFVKTTYRWKRSGDKLRLTKLSGGCSDKVAETILTARALTKVP